MRVFWVNGRFSLLLMFDKSDYFFTHIQPATDRNFLLLTSDGKLNMLSIDQDILDKYAVLLEAGLTEAKEILEREGEVEDPLKYLPGLPHSVLDEPSTPGDNLTVLIFYYLIVVYVL